MSWQLLIGLSIISYSVSVLLQRSLVKEADSQPVAYSIFFQLSTGILITVFGFLVSHMTLPDLYPLAVNLILMTLLYGFGNVCIFRSLKDTEASKFTVLFATRALFTIAGSTLFLHEGLTGKQMLGALSIFAGVVIVNLKASKLVFGKGELLALLAAVCFGLGNTNDRFLLHSFDIYPFMSLGFIAPAVLMAGIYPGEMKRFAAFLHWSVLKKIFLLCVVYAFSAITFFAALKTAGNSSQVASVNLTGVIVTVLLSIIFLREREDMRKKIIGALLSFAGLLLVS